MAIDPVRLKAGAASGVRSTLPNWSFLQSRKLCAFAIDSPRRAEGQQDYKRGEGTRGQNRKGPRIALEAQQTDRAIICQMRYVLCHLMPNAVPPYAKWASANTGVFRGAVPCYAELDICCRIWHNMARFGINWHIIDQYYRSDIKCSFDL